MRAVLAHRQVRRYLAAQLLSVFGDTTLWLAVGIWVKELTGSSSAAGLVFFFFGLPYLFAPFAGMLVDRVRRAPLLVAVNLASAVVVLALLLVHDDRQLWLVYLVIFLYGASGLLIGAGQSALLAGMLPEHLLAEANGILQTGREGLRLVSPLLGAGVVAATGSAHPVAVFDAVTFAAAAVVVARLRLSEPAPAEREPHWRQEVVAGIRHVWRTRPLRQVVTTTAIACLVVGFSETIVFPVTEQGLHRPTTFVGVLVTVMGVGAIAGGVTGAAAVRRLGDGRALAVGLAVAAVGYLGWLAGDLPLVLAGVVVEGFGIPWVIIAFTTSIQVRTPAQLQGRAYTAADAAVSTPQTLSIAAGAGLVAVVDYRWLVLAISVTLAAAAAHLLTRRIDWRAPAPGAQAAPPPRPAVDPIAAADVRLGG